MRDVYALRIITIGLQVYNLIRDFQILLMHLFLNASQESSLQYLSGHGKFGQDVICDNDVLMSMRSKAKKKS